MTMVAAGTKTMVSGLCSGRDIRIKHRMAFLVDANYVKQSLDNIFILAVTP